MMAITKDFCRIANEDFDCNAPGPGDEENDLLAPSGTRLPITAKFKGNIVARYEVPMERIRSRPSRLVHEGSGRATSGFSSASVTGDFPAYTTLDLSAGIKTKTWSAELYARTSPIPEVLHCAGSSVLKTVCGDPDGRDGIGGNSTTTSSSRGTSGLRVGTKF
jgi:hypothetical protein